MQLKKLQDMCNEALNQIDIKKQFSFSLGKYLKRVKIIRKSLNHYVFSFYKHELINLREDITNIYIEELEKIKWGLREVESSLVNINFPTEFEIIFIEDINLDQQRLEDKEIKASLFLGFESINVYIKEEDRQIELDIDVSQLEKIIVDQLFMIIFDTYLGVDFENREYDIQVKTTEPIIQLYSLYEEKK